MLGPIHEQPSLTQLLNERAVCFLTSSPLAGQKPIKMINPERDPCKYLKRYQSAHNPQ